MGRLYFLLVLPVFFFVSVAQAKINPAPVDIVLTSTWRPETGARINCHGGKISAGIPYKLNGDPHRHRIASKPAELIYLKDVYDVEIKNCEISGGDSAIFIVRGGGHKIIYNKITALNAIQMYSSSDNLIQDNLIRFGDVGVLVRVDSDRNRVIHNTIQLLSEALEGGVAVGAYSTPDAAVVNLIVEGELTQVLNDAHTLEDLEVNNNVIEIARGPGFEDDGFMGVALNGRTDRGMAKDNIITGGINGITSWGYEKFLPVVIPGQCSEDATRRCGEPADCFLPGFDKESKGQCEGADFLYGKTTEVLDSQFIGNTISNSVYCLSAYLAPTNRIESNDASGCIYGIRIGDYMLESGKVLGNIVHDSVIAFSIYNVFALYAGAEISYNDFSGYETGVAVEQDICDLIEFECNISPDPNGYQLDTLLSRNHWGANCEPPDLPTTVTTPESYGFPVAEKYREKPPKGSPKAPRNFGAFCN